MTESIVKNKSYDFALRIIKLYLFLTDKKHFEIANQIVRAGTSIGANVEEALAGFSRKDFTAKMSIASKEARETHYWLRLIRDSGLVGVNQVKSLLSESETLVKILTSIVKTSSNTGKITTKNQKLKTKNS
ncbi:MAG: four helix bundle protein [Sedimentisphaerales bacterium]|jgi:four helix bundle protein